MSADQIRSEKPCPHCSMGGTECHYMIQPEDVGHRVFTIVPGKPKDGK